MVAGRLLVDELIQELGSAVDRYPDWHPILTAPPRHDDRVAVDRRNTGWCSDGLEIACDNGEKVRVAFALDCCDREVMGHVATTGRITGQIIRVDGGTTAHLPTYGDARSFFAEIEG